MLHNIRRSKKQSTGIAQAGFTIIEVMIVLAIAGVIMGIVFLAIPNLQRNNRNTQRKNDAARIAGQVSEYISNNNGKLPDAIQMTSTAPTGATRILNVTTQTFSIMTAANVSAVACTSTTCSQTVPAADSFLYYTNADCGTGNNLPSYNASGRSFAIVYGIEGATSSQCITS